MRCGPGSSLSVGLRQVTSLGQTVWWFCISAATANCIPQEGLLHRPRTLGTNTAGGSSDGDGNMQLTVVHCTLALQAHSDPSAGSVCRHGAVGWIQTRWCWCWQWHWMQQDPGTGPSGRNILSKLNQATEPREDQEISYNPILLPLLDSFPIYGYGVLVFSGWWQHLPF